MQDGIKPPGYPVGACSLGQVGSGRTRRLLPPGRSRAETR